MKHIILPANAKSQLSRKVNSYGTSSLIVAIKSIREELGIGLPECMRGIEAGKIEVPDFSPAPVARLLIKLEKLLPGTAALNEASPPSDTMSDTMSKNHLDEAIFILQNSLDINDPHHVKEMVQHALRFLSDHKKTVYLGKDLYILAQVGAWIKDPTGEISFLGVGRCRRLSLEEETSVRNQIKEQSE